VRQRHTVPPRLSLGALWNNAMLPNDSRNSGAGAYVDMCWLWVLCIASVLDVHGQVHGDGIHHACTDHRMAVRQDCSRSSTLICCRELMLTPVRTGLQSALQSCKLVSGQAKLG
jgi:hypothetical protein